VRTVYWLPGPSGAPSNSTVLIVVPDRTPVAVYAEISVADNIVGPVTAAMGTVVHVKVYPVVVPAPLMAASLAG
jgi:hypothetical protein